MKGRIPPGRETSSFAGPRAVVRLACGRCARAYDQRISVTFEKNTIPAPETATGRIPVRGADRPERDGREQHRDGLPAKRAPRREDCPGSARIADRIFRRAHAADGTNGKTTFAAALKSSKPCLKTMRRCRHAVPKRRTSKARKRSRRALEARSPRPERLPAVPRLRLAHRVRRSCGFYDGRKVAAVKTDAGKRA